MHSMVDSETSMYCLIGDPVKGSLSPLIHNAAFNHLQLNSVYLAFHVSREDLELGIVGLRKLGANGFNVTIPHKTTMLPLLDELSTTTRLVGACNTVVNRNRRLVGYNTDVDGVLSVLENHDVQVEGSQCVVIGAGGFARGAVGALCMANCSQITMLCRNRSKGEAVAKELSENLKKPVKCESLTSRNLNEILSDAEILINATPVGTSTELSSSPLAPDSLSRHVIVIDAVYKPVNTRLLRDARRAGARTISGLHLLLEQAAASFRLWTGKEPPMDVMREAASRRVKVLA